MQGGPGRTASSTGGTNNDLPVVAGFRAGRGEVCGAAGSTAGFAFALGRRDWSAGRNVDCPIAGTTGGVVGVSGSGGSFGNDFFVRTGTG